MSARATRIAIYLPNGVDWIEACFAGLRAGAVVVPISYDAAEGEISYRLTDAGCGIVITTAAQEGPGREDLRATRRSRPKMIYAGQVREQAGMSLADLARGAGAAAARSR